jgi:hypothetical protein
MGRFLWADPEYYRKWSCLPNALIDGLWQHRSMLISPEDKVADPVAPEHLAQANVATLEASFRPESLGQLQSEPSDEFETRRKLFFNL